MSNDLVTVTIPRSALTMVAPPPEYVSTATCLEVLGEPLEDRLRRDGPTAYWPGFVKRLRTVVEEGGFGCLHLGDGDDAASQQIGVEPRDELARVYAGLASHAQTGTAPELRPRRPGRPRRELGPSRR